MILTADSVLTCLCRILEDTAVGVTEEEWIAFGTALFGTGTEPSSYALRVADAISINPQTITIGEKYEVDIWGDGGIRMVLAPTVPHPVFYGFWTLDLDQMARDVNGNQAAVIKAADRIVEVALHAATPWFCPTDFGLVTLMLITSEN